MREPGNLKLDVVQKMRGHLETSNRRKVSNYQLVGGNPDFTP